MHPKKGNSNSNGSSVFTCESKPMYVISFVLVCIACAPVLLMYSSTCTSVYTSVSTCICMLLSICCRSFCLLVQEKLQPPLLACRIGRLYNKEAVIKALLEKALPAHMKHVKSLKDMKEVQVDVRDGCMHAFMHACSCITLSRCHKEFFFSLCFCLWFAYFCVFYLSFVLLIIAFIIC